jgi:hypothetical protein
LQSHSGKVCGECPPGLAFNADGLCVAQPTVAQSRPGDGLQQSASTGETLPWKAATVSTGAPATGRPLFTPVATSVVSSEPLPGRMAIGGPKELPPVDSANAAAVYMPTGKANQPLATATLEGAQATSAPKSTPPTGQRKSSYRRSSGQNDPIRHNLMLSLGGSY